MADSIARLLLVEDSPDDALLIQRELERDGLRFEAERVETREDFEAALERPWDVVILDYALPTFSGPDALELLAERGIDTPAIVVSGTIAEETAVSALRGGARDFVTKGQLRRLYPAVLREMEEAESRREQRRTRVALERSQGRFRAVIESARDLISIMDAEGRFLYASPSYETVLGYEPHELLGTGGFDLLHPDDHDRLWRILQEGLEQNQESALVECRLRHRDGSWRTIETVARNLLDDPPVGGIVLISRDITDQRHLEEQLQQTQRLEAIGQLAGGIAHDFNNVLLVVRGYGSILEEALAGTEHRQKAHAIVEAAEHAAALTRQLLAFGRRQTLEPTLVELAGVVDGAETLLQRLLPSDVELIAIGSPDPVMVLADVGQLEQVLVNLATNARDAMPEGGALTIGWETVELGPSTTTHTTPPLPPGRYATLRVGDTGTGIDDETLARIFEPFFTTKPEGVGTGLGLATVYGIVSQSGGAISVETAVGAGSTFSVYLPAADGTPPTAAGLSDDAALEGTETILLVEDENAVRELVETVLRERGYAVMSAAGPSAGAELSKAHPGEIDILVSDVVMPEMSGYELAESLQAQQPRMRCLYISGYARGLRSSGEMDVTLLQKPFSMRQLLTKVREIADAPAPERGAVA